MICIKNGTVTVTVIMFLLCYILYRFKVDTFLEFYCIFFKQDHHTKDALLGRSSGRVDGEWHWTPGFHGEQGAESIHRVFNQLERTYSSVQNPNNRLRRNMEEHHLQIHPLATHAYHSKKRKVTNTNI